MKNITLAIISMIILGSFHTPIAIAQDSTDKDVLKMSTDLYLSLPNCSSFADGLNNMCGTLASKSISWAPAEIQHAGKLLCKVANTFIVVGATSIMHCAICYPALTLTLLGAYLLRNKIKAGVKCILGK